MSESPTEQRLSAETEAALEKAAQLLCSARMPLVYGLSQATLEAQSVAVDIAEALRCIVDTPASTFAEQRGTTLQLHGGSHTTHGEFNRFGDLEILITTTARLSGMKDPCFKGNLDELQLSYQNPQLNQTDDDYLTKRTFIQVPASAIAMRLEEMIVFLKEGAGALAKLRSRTNSHRNTSEDSRWDQLHAVYQNAKYPIIRSSMHLLICAPVPAEKQKLESELIQSLLEQIAIQKGLAGRAAYTNSGGRFHAGADYVLTARTGATCAISFANGFAQHSPLDFSAAAAVKRELADAILYIGDSELFDSFVPSSTTLPQIAIVAKKPEKLGKSSDKNIFIQSRNLFEEEEGTILREDGVPIPLRPKKVSELPTLESVLKRLLELIQSQLKKMDS